MWMECSTCNIQCNWAKMSAFAWILLDKLSCYCKCNCNVCRITFSFNCLFNNTITKGFNKTFRNTTNKATVVVGLFIQQVTFGQQNFIIGTINIVFAPQALWRADLQCAWLLAVLNHVFLLCHCKLSNRLCYHFSWSCSGLFYSLTWPLLILKQ